MLMSCSMYHRYLRDGPLPMVNAVKSWMFHALSCMWCMVHDVKSWMFHAISCIMGGFLDVQRKHCI